jgi:hypothetical protein
MPVLLQLRLCPVVTDLGSFDLKQKSVIIGHDSAYQYFKALGRRACRRVFRIAPDGGPNHDAIGRAE